MKFWFGPTQFSLQRLSRHPAYTLVTLGIVALIGVLWISFPASSIPPLSVHFARENSDGIRVDPFGQIIITNHGTRRLYWSGVKAEAHGDTNLFLVLAQDSYDPLAMTRFGVLEGGASTNLPVSAPDMKGDLFRILIPHMQEPNALGRLRAKLPRPLPGIDTVWPRPNRWRTFTSEWFHATADYKRTNEGSEKRY